MDSQSRKHHKLHKTQTDWSPRKNWVRTRTWTPERYELLFEFKTFERLNRLIGIFFFCDVSTLIIFKSRWSDKRYRLDWHMCYIRCRQFFKCFCFFKSEKFRRFENSLNRFQIWVKNKCSISVGNQLDNFV